MISSYENWIDRHVPSLKHKQIVTVENVNHAEHESNDDGKVVLHDVSSAGWAIVAVTRLAARATTSPSRTTMAPNGPPPLATFSDATRIASRRKPSFVRPFILHPRKTEASPNGTKLGRKRVRNQRLLRACLLIAQRPFRAHTYQVRTRRDRVHRTRAGRLA